MQRTGNTAGYEARLIWSGNRGTGTQTYTSYDRQYRILVSGKPELTGSAAAAFRGDPALHDPEDFFLAAVSSCHMLAYLALCAGSGVTVLAYEDDATGTLMMSSGGGGFTEIVLSPVVVVAPGADAALATKLHETAHQRCFIANSCSVPIVVRPTVRVQVEAE